MTAARRARRSTGPAVHGLCKNDPGRRNNEEIGTWRRGAAESSAGGGVSAEKLLAFLASKWAGKF
jgi:hypothetical protein